MKKHKYIFVLGGVMSGVGKGITTASIGLILKSKGFKVNLVKIDPYLNVDAGTMNPTEHGETFVLDSGLETDQDMGNYERFLNRDLGPDDYITSGMVFKTVIERERSLGYGGKCVQAIPHVTNEIMERILRSGKDSDITIVEIGGTVGDYENILFIETARILKIRQPEDVMSILVSYFPVPGTLGEMKSKPTQNAVRQLNSYGVHSDMIIARSTHPVDDRRKEKIADATSVPARNIISAPDIDSIYDVPVNFSKDTIGETIMKTLRLKPKADGKELLEWKKFIASTKKLEKTVSIAVVGKYFDTGDFVLADSYVSVIEAIKFSSYKLGVKAKITWINAKNFETGKLKVSMLKDFDAVLVPGGFGEAGVEGKIQALNYCRINKIPCLGICYGMQLMVIEYGRNVLGFAGAHTTEISPKTKYPLIHIMPEQEKKMLAKAYGGTMRLGAYDTVLGKGSVAYEAYGKVIVSERHRHRYEVNNEFKQQIADAGLVFSGTSPDGLLAEIVELSKDKHPFFLGTQFHPELRARPLAPHPLFTAFIKAGLK